MSARISRVLPFVMALGLGTSAAGFGCKAKPSEKACREAIENIRRISGQDANDVGADPVAAVRSCRGNSSKEAVECMRVAKTITDLEKCEAAGGMAAPAPAGKEAPEGKTEAATKPAAEPTEEEAPAIDPVGHEAAATGGEAAKTAPGTAEPAAPTAAEPAAEPTAAPTTAEPAAAPTATEPAKAEPAAP